MKEQRKAVAEQKAVFTRLMDEYAPAMRRLAGVYARTLADRDDLFQEIAAAVWTAIPRFRGEASERTWLYRIGHNVGITYAAKKRRTDSRERQADAEWRAIPVDENSEEKSAAARRHALLVEALRQLAGVDQQLVMLQLEGLTYEEIAGVTGLSESNVGARLTRCRKRLAELVRKAEAET